MVDSPARQPYLHDLIGLVAAPSQCWSGADGDITPAQIGVVHADVRLVRAARLTVDGVTPVLIRGTSEGPTSRFVSLARNRQDERLDGPDPTLRLDRVRTLVGGELTETITLSSHQDRVTAVVVAVEIDVDATMMDEVKGGRPPGDPVDVTVAATSARWSGHGVEAELTAPDAEITRTAAGIVVTRTIALAPRGRAELVIRIAAADANGPVVAAAGALAVDRLVTDAQSDRHAVLARDLRLGPWLSRSLADLNGLRLRLRDQPDEFLGAGAPWYLTLFGRDSLWTARLLLPVDVTLAGGTLRTLARLQGRRVDPATEEAPGKIIHELRRPGITFLPPAYYGTIDATCLWITLLHDAWRAGLPAEQVRSLLPHLTAALGWIRDSSDPDGDGFCEYQDSTGRGLANQGWKDSADSIRFHDGKIAEGPVALCEAQAYAYEALVGGAAVLAAFDAGAPDQWLELAAALATRFRARFWVERTGLPALALDGRKRQVDAVTSNLGHLLGTGILAADEERRIADRLIAPDLDSGLGLRTMSSADAGYNPLSYHCGSVWPHDTAIAIRGLLAGGFVTQAARLADGLAEASVVFDRRLPELYSGEGAPGVAYPASCRPQAWSAAAVVPALDALVARG